jgi:hypothetical protein
LECDKNEVETDMLLFDEGMLLVEWGGRACKSGGIVDINIDDGGGDEDGVDEDNSVETLLVLVL